MKIIDLHADTITALYYQNNKEETLASNSLHLDIEKMRSGKYLGQCFAIFINCHKVLYPYEECLNVINYYHDQLLLCQKNIKPVLKYHDLIDKTMIMKSILTIEDAGIIGSDLSKMEELYNLGVRMMSLTWNYPNSLGNPHSINLGLTQLGIEAIKVMNDLGIIIDCSHLSKEGFWDIYKYSKKPFIASHSNCYALRGHSRNLDDDQIRALSQKGGVIGINFYPPHLGDSQLDDIIRHLKHLIKIGGIGCASIGSDFDGIEGELQLKDGGYLLLLEEEMIKEGFTKEEIEAIFYKNFLRVCRQCWN